MAVFPTFRGHRALMCGAALLTLGACANSGFDLDLRNTLGHRLDTSEAARSVRTADRPRPDNRGVISYPNYQVAVARRGDTLAAVAGRVGLPVEELARYNGMPSDLTLRKGEIIALPRRVAEPSPATGATTTGPILPVPTAVSSAPISSAPLDDSTIQPARPQTAPAGKATQSGAEPVRHKVTRGETAYSIARQYGIPVHALAEWNGLTGELAIRDGQYLLIPVALSAPRPLPESAPGAGSVAPVPPSAAEPLPDENATAAKPKETPASPDFSTGQTKASSDARFVLPVNGPIIRAFKKGKNDGIDISASAGAPVHAADAGTVAAITRDTDQVPILVLRHSNNILTVYAGVDEISVKKGQNVKRGQQVAKVRGGASPGLHFEVREGFESVDPVPYVN